MWIFALGSTEQIVAPRGSQPVPPPTQVLTALPRAMSKYFNFVLNFCGNFEALSTYRDVIP